jgi:hypothetical protein
LVQNVTGNLVEISSAVRIEIFNGVNVHRCKTALHIKTLFGFIKGNPISLQHHTWQMLHDNVDILFTDENKSVVSSSMDDRKEWCIFTVVRNPYHRIVSDLFYLKKVNDKTDILSFQRIISKYLMYTNDNDNDNDNDTKIVTANNIGKIGINNKNKNLIFTLSNNSIAQRMNHRHHWYEQKMNTTDFDNHRIPQSKFLYDKNGMILPDIKILYQ